MQISFEDHICSIRLTVIELCYEAAWTSVSILDIFAATHLNCVWIKSGEWCAVTVNVHLKAARSVMPSHRGPHLMWQPGLSWHMVQMGPVSPSYQTKDPSGTLSACNVLTPPLLPAASSPRLRFMSLWSQSWCLESCGGKRLHLLAARHHV